MSVMQGFMTTRWKAAATRAEDVGVACLPIECERAARDWRFAEAWLLALQWRRGSLYGR